MNHGTAKTESNDDLERLLAERARIDRKLLEEHATQATVLFTDIVGSTATYEAKGDIEGLRRVQAHNRALFPVVEAHRGRVIKTIGDAIMATFDAPSDGARCAIEMQLCLRELSREEPEPIEIRAGLHAGQVLVDGDDLFGDTVNTAARVASHAQAGEVWVTESLLTLANDAGLRVVDRQPLAFKGKAEKVPCARLGVMAEDAVTTSPVKEELLMVECVRGRAGLRVAVIDGDDDKGTVKQYEENAVEDGALRTLTTHFRSLAHGGGLSESYLSELKARGADLAALAFGPRAQSVLKDTAHTHLRLHIDDALVDIPWELCDLGRGFFGTEFALGRMVSAAGEHKVKPRTAPASGSIVIISNPTGDLDAATREGAVLQAMMLEAGAPVLLLEGPRTQEQVCAAITDAGLVHFAGHAVNDSNGSALLCSDGPLRLEDLRAALVRDDESRAPSMVFANACHMGGEAWEAGAFAHAALNFGVEHFLAPTWEIPDDDALFFALRFWEGALGGLSYGESARRARVALAQDGARPLSFAGYVLYGDPRRRFPLAPRANAGAPLPTRSERSGEFETIRADAPKQADSPPSSSNGHAPPPSAAVTAVPAFPPQDPRPATAAPAAGATNPKLLAALAAGALVVIGIGAIALWSKADGTERDRNDEGALASLPSSSALAPTPVKTKPVVPAAPAPTGRVAVSVLPFKNGTGDPANDPLREGMMEAAVTALSNVEGTRLIERGQIDLDIGELEFSNSAYVDPATRAELGRIVGAEVVIMGTTVAAQRRLRTMARLVHVATGEILSTTRVDGSANDVFALQDKMAAELKQAIAALPAKLRSEAPDESKSKDLP